MNTVSGLDRAARVHVRDLACAAADKLLAHPGRLHYTEGAARWQGLEQHLVAADGELITYGDCSSTVTWLIAQGLLFDKAIAAAIGHRDLVNGADWMRGFTGTIAEHGRVEHETQLIRCDLVLYGTPGTDFEHVAMVRGHRPTDGKPMVFSHGSETGPYLIPFDYREDVGEFRRMF